MVGLENVDNTADNSKPISSLTQTALNAKADSSTTYTKGDVDNGLNLKIGGNGTVHYLPKFIDTRVVANPSFQENAVAQIGIGGPPDPYFKLRITGNGYVDDSTSGNGIVLASNLENRPLISRQMNNFTSVQNTHWQMGFVCGTNRVVLSFSRDGLQFWSRVYRRISGELRQAIESYSQ